MELQVERPLPIFLFLHLRVFSFSLVFHHSIVFGFIAFTLLLPDLIVYLPFPPRFDCTYRRLNLFFGYRVQFLVKVLPKKCHLLVKILGLFSEVSKRRVSKDVSLVKVKGSAATRLETRLIG